MNLTQHEKKILKKIAESKLITKTDLKKFLKEDGSSNAEVILELATKGLIEKNLVVNINPIGSTCYIITKKGNKFIQELD